MRVRNNKNKMGVESDLQVADPGTEESTIAPHDSMARGRAASVKSTPTYHIKKRSGVMRSGQ